jgi:hypothetical protein
MTRPERFRTGWNDKRATEKACKPGSVPRVSGATIISLGRRLPGVSSGLTREPRAGDPNALLFGLAPGGVCRAGAVTRVAGELLPHRFTLTVLADGGLFSVALSVGLPPLGVTQHPALWSPDFPPATLP